MFADNGETAYVIPWKFDMLINAAHFSTEWNDLCGLIKCKDENSFKTIDFGTYSKFLKKEVALDTDGFEKIKNILFEKFNKEYYCFKD